MREKARRLIFKYVNEHQDDLTRTWATERPFELYLDGVVVSGRADVIYDEHDGVDRQPRDRRLQDGDRMARSTRSSCRCTPTPADAKD